MGEKMDNLVRGAQLNKVFPNRFERPNECVTILEEDYYLKLKKKHGECYIVNHLPKELVLDIGIFPLRKIVPLDYYDEQGYETGDISFGISFAFKYNKIYYLYSEYG